MEKFDRFHWSLNVSAKHTFVLGDIGPIARYEPELQFKLFLFAKGELSQIFLPISDKHMIVGKSSKDSLTPELYEINEASAAQTLFCVDALGLPHEKVNVNGGAVALGHPPGLTGARLILTALYALREREKKYAVVSQCAGGGCGMATVIRAWGD